MSPRKKFARPDVASRESELLAMSRPNNWFSVPIARPHAQVRLICFPYAGGSPWMYNGWAATLPSEIEVNTVQLPGRGKRIGEAMPTELDELVKELHAAMKTKMDRHYAIFGHSFGAVLATHLADAVRRAEGPAPKHVFISGCPAPEHWGASLNIHELPDAAFIQVMRERYGLPAEVLENPELLAMTISMLREDFQLAANSRQPSIYIDAPTSVLFGMADPETSIDMVTPWATHSSSGCALHSFAAGHFFIHSHRDELLRILTKALMQVR